jgi:iron uptake system EfeUOB component EfeO/EfeM
MTQVKLSFRERQAKFINNYQAYGFKDKGALVRAALDHFQAAIEKEDLEKSAALYAEIYAADPDLKSLTESALTGWPE